MSIKNIKINLIGAGNLATQLGLALHENGIKIGQVYSRTIEPAKTLAEKLQSNFTNKISDIKHDAGLYVVSVADDAVTNVISELEPKKLPIVHTAGSLAMDLFKNHATNYGVFYPLQTFSKNKKVNFSEIPICLEANNPTLEKTIWDIAKLLSKKVYKINSEQRKNIHIAAVLACNFTNHLYALAEDLLKTNNIDFDIIRPLIKETAEKAMTHSPAKVQTGPAVREDMQVVKNHLELLSCQPNLHEIYKLLSNSIIAKNSNEG